MYIKVFYTYTKNAINEWIVTAIRHGKPMATEKYDIDVPITEKKLISDIHLFLFIIFIIVSACKYECILYILISAFFKEKKCFISSHFHYT